MVGLDAAGKTTILYKLKLGEIVTTIPTIGASGSARLWRLAVHRSRPRARATTKMVPPRCDGVWKLTDGGSDG